MSKTVWIVNGFDKVDQSRPKRPKRPKRSNVLLILKDKPITFGLVCELWWWNNVWIVYGKDPFKRRNRHQRRSNVLLELILNSFTLIIFDTICALWVVLI